MQVTRRSQTRGPTNTDLINILRSRVEQDKRPSFITDMHNLYEKEPWLIQHVRHVTFEENLWFYFVTRKQFPGIKKSDSKRPSRKVVGSGRWKTTGVLTENKDGVVGFVKTISFKADSETVEDGITTGWVMHEFVLDKPGFQELALCRIRFHPRKDNAQYAPRLTTIVIGVERGDGSKLVETHQDQGMEQWTGSCSGEVVSNLALQHQKIMGQDSNYPIFNGGMEQHQDFRSCGQQKAPILGHMEHYGQGSGDRGEYQNQYLGQETTDPKKVPMMALNEYSGHLPSQHQHFSLNGSKEQHQSLSSCGGLLGESSGQQLHHSTGRQATYLSLMEVQLSAQAMEEQQQQQGNGYSALYSSKPYVQRMIDRQVFGGSSALRMDQKNEYLRQKNDLLALSEQEAPKHFSQDSNLPLTQPQNKILGQATHNVQCSAQPYDQYKGQNNELTTIPKKTQIQNNELTTVPISFKTQQQQDAFIRNSAARIHLEAQDDVPLIAQTLEAQATDPPIDSQEHQELLGDDVFQGMDTEMADLSDDFCDGDLAQQFEKIPIPYSMFY